MTCVKFTQGLLSDYTDNAVTPVQRLWVRRHLRHCPNCTREVAALENLNRDARRLYADTEPFASSPVRSRRAVLRPLLATGMAALVAGLWFAPEMPGRPRVAFADVENAMRQVKTAHWTETYTAYGSDGKPQRRTDSEVWAQMEPPLLITRSRTTNFTPPAEASFVETRYKTQNESLHQTPFGWVRTVSIPAAPFKLRKAIQNSILPGIPQPDDQLYGTRTRWTQEIVQVRGVPQLYFRRDMTGRANFSSACEWWADPRTRYLTRHVARWRWASLTHKGTIASRHCESQTAENFRFNEPLPPEVLGFKPAPGAKIHDLTPR